MLLSDTQITLIFNAYLREYALKRSVNPLPVFQGVAGGLALTKRLYKILREPRLEHLAIGTSINFLELLNHLREFFSEHDYIYIVGLDHAFSLRDVDVLHEIYLRKILNNK